MKYFTADYLADWECMRPDDETHLAYARNIARIKPELPDDLRRLCDLTPGWAEDKILLNDSGVRQIECSFEEQSVTITLDGEYTNAEGHQLGQRNFYLHYQEVTDFQCVAPWPMGIGYGLAGFGDHLADEIELIQEGLFEHRMLFSSGIKLAVVFRQFFLSHSDIPHESFPPT